MPEGKVVEIVIPESRNLRRDFIKATRALRRQGLTMAQTAEAMGISRQRMYQILRESNVDLDSLHSQLV